MFGYVYLIGSEVFGWYKIGKAKRPEIRIHDLGIILPFKIQIYAIWKSEDCRRLEAQLHLQYCASNINGEWFHFSPERVRDIVFKDLVHLERTFAAGTDKSSHFARFSNLKKDKFLLNRFRPFLTDAQREKRKTENIAQRNLVKKWLAENNLPNTPNNRSDALARIIDMHADLSSPSETPSGFRPSKSAK